MVLRAQPRAPGVGAARRGGREDGRHGRDQLRPHVDRRREPRGRDAAPGRHRPCLPRARHLRRARVPQRGARARSRHPAPAHRPERRLGSRLPEQARLEAAAAAAGLGAAAPAPAPAARQGGRAVHGGPDRLPGRARPRAARLRLAQLALCRFADGVQAGRGRGVRRRRAPWALRRRRGRRGRVPAGRGCRDGRPNRDRRARRRGSTGATSSAATCPTHRTFTVLGKALDPAQPIPERPHFELGDLDFL